MILSISEHPHHFIRMTWEGLYVALSRVKFRDDIRLLLKSGDRSTMNYIKGLKKNAYIKSFFKGYRQTPLPPSYRTKQNYFTGHEQIMTWDPALAAADAGFI